MPYEKIEFRISWHGPSDPVSNLLIPYEYCTNARALNRIWIRLILVKGNLWVNFSHMKQLYWTESNTPFRKYKCFSNYTVWTGGWGCCAINHQQHSSLTSFHDSLSYVTFLILEWRIETNFPWLFSCLLWKGIKKLKKCLLPSVTIFYSSKDIKVQSFHNE